MSNTLISHGGGIPDGYDVTEEGTRLAAKRPHRKYWACTNASDEPIYLALYQLKPEGGVNTAEVGKGIYLAPNGGSFELNNVNMYYGEIWAIHAGSGPKRVCVQSGQ